MSPVGEDEQKSNLFLQMSSSLVKCDADVQSGDNNILFHSFS